MQIRDRGLRVGEGQPGSGTGRLYDGEASATVEHVLRVAGQRRYARTQPFDWGACRLDPDAEDTGEPFTDAQLQAIFDPVAFPAWAKKYPHRWFGPILRLYSGARVKEITQLCVGDIDTIDGIPGFFVRDARRTEHQEQEQPPLRPTGAARALFWLFPLR